jgi:predicted RNA-binding Zn-ribbon protein involved in translation (DUF1610 family)
MGGVVYMRKLNKRYKIIKCTNKYHIIGAKGCRQCGEDLQSISEDSQYCPDCLLEYRTVTLFLNEEGNYLADGARYYTEDWVCPKCGERAVGKANIESHIYHCRGA